MKSNLLFFSDYVFISSQCVFDLQYCFCPDCDYPHSQWDTSNRPLGMTTFTNFSTLEFTLNHNNTFLLSLAMSLDIQINIQVPDTEGVLLECTSGSLIPPAEMTWRDSNGNIIPPQPHLTLRIKLGYFVWRAPFFWRIEQKVLLLAPFTIKLLIRRKREVLSYQVSFYGLVLSKVNYFSQGVKLRRHEWNNKCEITLCASNCYRAALFELLKSEKYWMLWRIL